MDASISQLCKSFTQFHYQTRKLSELNKDLIEFNQIFSSFLLGLQLTAECLSVPPQQSPLKVEDEIEEKDCVVASLSLSPRTSLVKQGATKTQVKPSVSVPMMEAVEVKCQEVKSSARATPRIPSKVPYKPSSSQGGNRKDVNFITFFFSYFQIFFFLLESNDYFKKNHACFTITST